MNAVIPTTEAKAVNAGPTAPGASDGDADADPDQPPEHGGPLDAPRIECIDDSGRDLDTAWLYERLVAATRHAGMRINRLTAMIVDDDRMRRLHREHRGDDETTDVLTFVSAGPPEPIEADIAVCADEARRRAAAAGHHGVERELLLYIVHGLLHAEGFDDHAPDDFTRMHAREDEILEAIGVGAVFRGGEGDRSGHDDDRRPPVRDHGSSVR